MPELIHVYQVVFCLCFVVGWFCCNCYSPPPCNQCTADNDTVTLTLGGFSGMGVCDCARVFNGAWVLSREYANACYWHADFSYVCVAGGPTRYVNMEAWVTGDGAQLCFFVQLYWNGVFYNYKWPSGGWGGFDCTSTRSASFVNYVLGALGATPCTGYASTTCQIN